MRIEARLQERGLTLPEPLNPYPGVPVRFAWVRVCGNRAYVSPHMKLNKDGTLADLSSKVGAEVSPERARKAARGAALAMLASLKQKAANNRKRADGGEGYHNKEDCRADALAVHGEPRADVAIYDILDEDEEEA